MGENEETDQTSIRHSANLAQRLNLCAEKVGGKRALATQCGISEPQLYRYLRGEGEPTASKVVEIAKMAQVDAGWLLNGEGAQDPIRRRKPVYESDIYLETDKLLSEAFLRIDRKISAENKALMADILLYERLQQAYVQGAAFPLNLNGAVSNILFLLAFDDTALARYRDFMQNYFLAGKVLEEVWGADSLIPLCNSIHQAQVSLFDGPYGVLHYGRMGQTLWPQAAKRLQGLVATIQKINPQKTYRWLDVGCGNGREMSFLFRNFEHIDVHGIESSQHCIDLCLQQISVSNLPEGCVEKADVRYYKSKQELFDVVYSRLVVDQFVYVPYAPELGVLQVMTRLSENLKSKGVLSLIIRRGQGMEFGMFQTAFSQQDITDIAEKTGFTLVSCVRVGDQKTRYDDCWDVLLQKK